MKKRKLCALILALLLLFQTASLPAAATDTVYFTAVNETVLALSDATMPFWSGGYLYVSCTLFSNRDLGLSYSAGTIQKRAVIWDTNAPRTALIFDLTRNTVDDGDGNGYYPPAILRNSHVFVPISLIAAFFGLTYTSTKVSHGYLIRIRGSGSTLSDSVFADAAGTQLESRYEQYQKAREPQSTTPSPVVPQPDADTEELPPSGQTVYLALRATDSEKTGKLLSALKNAGAAATFYLTEEEIRQDGDLVRRILVSGQTIGLLADGSDSSASVSEQLNRANNALCEAASGKTRLCYVSGGTAQKRADAEEAGYCCLVPDLDRSASTLSGSTGAKSLLTRIGARSGAVSVWLGDAVTENGLLAFLSAAAEGKDRIAGMTETT